MAQAVETRVRADGRADSAVYTWLLAREERADGRAVAERDGSGSWDGTQARLAELRAGRPVDIPAAGLPVWARTARTEWWHRAAVDTEGARFYDDDGSGWLAEAGL